MRIGSLFSGVGLLELGLERAGLGETVWQVESDPFCRAVLAKHWPHARRFDDVRTVGAKELEQVDLICGGFPCQDISSAGTQFGLAGTRSGLWYEFARIADECRPQWIVVENVASGAKLWVDTVRGDLGRLGYASLPIALKASDLGAKQRRARIFLVAHVMGVEGKRSRKGRGLDQQGWRAKHASSVTAYADGERHDAVDINAEMASASKVKFEGEPTWAGGAFSEPDVVRVVHGRAVRVDGRRQRALGNAVVPQCAEVIGEVIKEITRRVAGLSTKGKENE